MMRGTGRTVNTEDCKIECFCSTSEFNLKINVGLKDGFPIWIDIRRRRVGVPLTSKASIPARIIWEFWMFEECKEY